MRSVRPLLAPLFALTVSLSSGTARSTVVEKVVAVVGDRAILLSDLRQRARPYLVQIQQRVPKGAQQAAAEYDLMRQMLQRMIDDQIEADVAMRNKITVPPEEVDAAIERLAGSQQITVSELLAEVMRGGLTAQEYRDEIRRQILEGKLVELRVKGQVRVTEEDMRSMYERMAREERKSLGYRAQWIVLKTADDPASQANAQRRRLAEELVRRAQSGEDFAALAKRYSDDIATKNAGGDLGPQRPGDLDDPIEQVAHALEVGQVSAPFRYQGAIVILRVTQRDPSKLGSFEQMRDLVAQRVYAEQLERARRRWLDNLKRGIHIDVRL